MSRIAAIRIRGAVRASGEVKDTLEMLRLHRRNACTVFGHSPSLMGMLRKVKDYVAWGEIDDETLRLLTEKRGEKLPDGKPKKFFRLNPPRGGFERKGVKKGFGQGGALGYRGAEINSLIKRMV